MTTQRIVSRLKETANPNTDDRVISILLILTDKQLDSLVSGLSYAGDFFDGAGFDTFKGDMLVAKSESVTGLALGMNTMRWVSKYLFPEVTKVPSDLYRISAVDKDQKSNLMIGGTVTITPHKPMLSWSDTPNTKGILGRVRPTGTLYVLVKSRIPKTDIIWSYKSLDIPKITYLGSLSKSGVDHRRRGLIIACVAKLNRLLIAPIEDEREVTVYHGTKPFKAEVIKLLK